MPGGGPCLASSMITFAIAAGSRAGFTRLCTWTRRFLAGRGFARFIADANTTASCGQRGRFKNGRMRAYARPACWQARS